MRQRVALAWGAVITSRPLRKQIHSAGPNLLRRNTNSARAATLASTESTSDDDLPRIIRTNGAPIHLFAHTIEPGALDQLKALAESPIPVDHVSAMPDCHVGQGVAIGTVFASRDYVCPNAVGVDIGCGMAAIPIEGLHKHHLKPDDLRRMQQMMKERIPTGFDQHRKTLAGTTAVIDQITQEGNPTSFLKSQLTLPRVTDQLGTLGGGNHFLEIVYETTEGQVWVMLHSGSRNIGNRVASHYNRVAKHRLEKSGVDTKALKGLNYMPIESDDGQNYLRDMEWSQQYAYHNRRVMTEIVLDIVRRVTGKEADMAKAVNIHHNYCQCETCGGQKLYVTRKGATSARQGEMGIIPGSMGTGSYITRGKGNLLGWNSSSHGAGRKMSRTMARANIPQSAFEESLRGVVCDTDPNLKDEAPQAYKDLGEVMKNQETLTEIVHHLMPLVNVKGFEDKPGHRKKRSKAGKTRKKSR